MTEEIIQYDRRRQDSFEMRLSHLERNDARLEEKLDNQSASLEEIKTLTRSIIEKQNAPTNWPAWLASIAAVVSVAGVLLVEAYISPVRERVDHISAAITIQNERLLDNSERVAIVERLYEISRISAKESHNATEAR